MRIAVNTRLLIKDKLEGIGWFTFETLNRITCQHPEHEFIFLFDRPYSEEFIFSKNVTPMVIGPQARHPFLFYLWLEFAVPLALKKAKADLFLSPDGYLSLSTKVRSLAVIHDLNFEHYPADLPFLVRKYYRYFFPRFAKKASRIATVSEFSKQDIKKLYGIDTEKIDVVGNGANESLVPISYEEQLLTRIKYSNKAPFFLFVGALNPRKNIARLFLAFDKFKNSYPCDFKLLIVGQKKWWTPEMRSAYENARYKQDIIFTGRLSTEELAKVIASAFAVTYISIFEGFGIPILEAMNCDVPVITSNVTSMPEVSGGAAYLVNPFSVDSISDAMLQLAKDENLRANLIEKGRIRRLNYSWQKTADKLWESIQKTVKA